MKPLIFRTLLVSSALLFTHCGLLDLDTDEEPTKKVTLKGTVAVPDGPPGVIVLNNTTNLAWYRFSCPKDGNRSDLSGGTFTLETMGNCSDAQYVYFYDDKGPRDLKAYANGKISFKVQVNSGGNGLTFLIQDANTVLSTPVNLASFGFDPSKVSVDQLITIPVTAITTPGFDFSKVERLFQMNATCPASNCLTTLKEIKWSPPDVVAALASVEPGPAFSPLRIGRIPHCDPFPCRRLPRANVGIMKPSLNGWTAEPSVPSTTTDSEGNFTLQVDANLLKGDGPVFIAVSDKDGSFTLISTIPDDLIRESAIIELPVDRTTTAVGMMTCANGITIPSDGSGGWCIGDPISSSELEAIYPVVNVALNTTISVDIEVYMPDVIDDAAALTALNKLLTDNGESTVTADLILAAIANNNFPIVTPRSTTPTGGTTTPDTGGPGLNATCQFAMTCDVCSVEACVSAGTDASTCSAGYKTSNGKWFACAACDNCTAAAQAATSYCCPTPQ